MFGALGPFGAAVFFREEIGQILFTESIQVFSSFYLLNVTHHCLVDMLIETIC